MALISLGCPKNLVDSERMLAGLALGGFAVTPDPDGADVAVVNTCAFIDLARAESDQHIDRLESLKAAGRLGRIVVAGCMAQRYATRSWPGTPRLTPSWASPTATRWPTSAAACLALPTKSTAGQDRPWHPRSCRSVRRRPPPPTTASGCASRRATTRTSGSARAATTAAPYCAIPEIRGPLRSKPPDQVLAEAAELVADGAKELILIGQDITAYGRDLPPLAAHLGGRLPVAGGSACRTEAPHHKCPGSA